MNLHLLGSFIFLSPLPQVTVALISFLETMLITYLSYKVRSWSTVHSFSLKSDLIWSDSFQRPVQVSVPGHLSKTRRRLVPLILDSDITHSASETSYINQFTELEVLFLFYLCESCKGTLWASVHMSLKRRTAQGVSNVSIMYSMEKFPQIERVSHCVRALRC